MRKTAAVGLALSVIGTSLVLSGCDVPDEQLLSTDADYTVDISVPYATATPLPDYMNVPDAIVIDSDGNVTVNDETAINNNFQSAKDTEADSGYSSLSIGQTGVAVQALQNRLKELGYFTADVSGIFDADTEDAVKLFEQTYGTMKTGVASVKMQMKLFSDTAPVYNSQEYQDAVYAQYEVLHVGDVGSSVFALQQRLRTLDYPVSDVSGVYDNDTAYAVSLFCYTNEMKVNQNASVAMQILLYSDDAKAYDRTAAIGLTPEPSSDDTIESETLLSTVEKSELLKRLTLKSGDVGEAVTLLQERLIALGYLISGNETSVFDSTTSEAVRQFQMASGLEETAELDEDTRDAIYADDAPTADLLTDMQKYQTISVGDSGVEVLELQRRLLELGYASGTPNGTYESATVSSVKLFQKYNGIEEDGVANSRTLALLYAEDTLNCDEAYEVYKVKKENEAELESQEQQASDELYSKLSYGSTGDDVTKLQKRLSKLKFEVEATGTFDDATLDAVLKFQSILSIPASGEATATFQRYIYSDAAPNINVKAFHSKTQSYVKLSLGDTGDEVTKLQNRLNEVGMLSQSKVKDSIGTYNEATESAVRYAQEKMGYPDPDGVAGVEFQAFLYSSYGEMLKNR